MAEASLRMDPSSTTCSAGVTSPFATRGAGRLSAAADAPSQLAPESVRPSPTQSSQLINLETITERMVDSLSPVAANKGVQLRFRQTLGPSVVRCSAPAGTRLLNHFVESLVRIARSTDHLVASVRHFTVPTVAGDPRRQTSRARVAVRIEHISFITTDADIVHDSMNTHLGGDVRCRNLLGKAYFECGDISDAFGGRLWSESGSHSGIAYCVDFPAADRTPDAPIHDNLT